MQTIMRTSSAVIISRSRRRHRDRSSVRSISAQRGPLQPPLIKEGVTEKDLRSRLRHSRRQCPSRAERRHHRRESWSIAGLIRGLARATAKRSCARSRRSSKGGDLYLAVTHFHPEHDLGAGRLSACAKMLRSRDQQADIDEFGLETAKRFASFSPVTAELLQGRRVPQGRSVLRQGADASISAACASG